MLISQKVGATKVKAARLHKSLKRPHFHEAPSGHAVVQQLETCLRVVFEWHQTPCIANAANVQPVCVIRLLVPNQLYVCGVSLVNPGSPDRVATHRLPIASKP